MVSKQAESGKPQAIREPLVHAGLVVCSVLVTLLLLEAALRVSGYRPGSMIHSRIYINPDNLYIYNTIPGVRFELRPFHWWGTMFPSNPRGYFDGHNIIWYRMNNAGYRGRDFALEKRPGTKRIAFLGDSFGFGTGVKEEDVVTTRLEARLNQESACPIEVYNFSIPGYSTRDEAAILEHRVLQYRPDLLIVWYFLNDPGSDRPFWKWKFLPWLRRYSVLADFVGAQVDRSVRHYSSVKIYREQHRDTDERWVSTKRHLQRMAGLARARGIPIYLFVHPYLYRISIGWMSGIPFRTFIARCS